MVLWWNVVGRALYSFDTACSSGAPTPGHLIAAADYLPRAANFSYESEITL
jgi:hypothetical protein